MILSPRCTDALIQILRSRKTPMLKALDLLRDLVKGVME